MNSFGLERAGRVQFVLGASHLSSLVGRDIIALRLRRDGSKHDLRGGSLRAVVNVSASNELDPNAPSPTFAANHHNPATLVFQGTVNAPTAPGLANRNAATWRSPDTVTVPFTTPFRYTGGTLCIQIDAVPVSGSAPRWWPIDAERATPGTVVSRGRACGVPGQQAVDPASVDARTLRIGTTCTFTTLGQPGATAVLMLAAQAIGPIDFGFLGAPGCELHVLPDVLVLGGVGAAILPGRPGAAAITLQLPNEQPLLGAQMHAQWVQLHGAILTTTNALDLRISPAASSLDGAVGAAARATPLPDVGRIEALLPVLQLDYR